MKAVVLLSKTFFPQHPKAGQPTQFADKVKYAVWIEEQGEICKECKQNGYDYECRTCTGSYHSNDLIPKIHTCRSSYSYWKDIIDRLKSKGGVLSVREWIDKPYKKPGQNTIIDIPAENVDVQKLTIEYSKQKFIPKVDNKIIHLPDLAANDGLTTQDYIDWFVPVFKKEKAEVLDFAIIHFTKFRY
jgi:hypothetical protein